MELVPNLAYSIPTGMNTTAWVKQWFKISQLDLPDPSEKPFDRLDEMFLL
jgi:hypothetical protein